MYTALYRTYRPETFDEILGQEHIVKILKNQLASETVSHAYLFCGTRGTGKTTTARILAKGVNCTAEEKSERPCGKCSNCLAVKEGAFMDVIEIDAASNNGVDNIRELRESVKYPPAMGRKKVYIIDEVHMLTTGAFNALLKTLEEPPEHIMFILATTEPQKLPATILSRCMKLDFKRVSEKVLMEGMARICREEGVAVSDSALKLIAANSDGSVRDGLSILDQCISGGQEEVSREDILEFLGTSGEEVFIELTDLVRFGDTSRALLLVDKVLADGKDVRQFLKDWLSHYRNLMIGKFVKKPEDMLNMSCENTERIQAQGETMELSAINGAILELSQTISDAKWSTQPRILLELAIVKLSAPEAGIEAKPARQKETQRISPSVKDDRPAKAQEYAKGQETAEENKPAKEQETVKESKPDKEAEDTESIKSEQLSQEENIPMSFDLEELWHNIFEEAETSKGSFNLIRTGTELTAMDEDVFVVTASNPAIENYVKNNKQLLEDFIEKHTGKRRGLKCVRADQGENGKGQTDPQKAAAQASELLGIDVEIE